MNRELAKYKLKIILVCLCLSGLVMAQNSYNQYNSNGKKHGYWKVFFDERICLTDSINSYYYSYNYYDNGTPTIYFVKIRWYKNATFKYDGVEGKKGRPIGLNGVCTRHYKNKFVSEIYVDGFINQYELKNCNKSDSIVCKENYIVYFSKKYENQEGSSLSENRNEKGEVTGAWYYRKGKRKWKSYPIN